MHLPAQKIKELSLELRGQPWATLLVLPHAERGDQMSATPAQPPPGCQLLRIPEAAYLLRVSPKTIYTLISNGELRAINLGTGKRSITRVRLDDINTLIRKRTR